MKLNKKKLIMLIKKDDYYEIYKEFKNWNIDKLQELIKELNLANEMIFEYYSNKKSNEKKEEIEINMDYAEYKIKENKKKLESFISKYNFLTNFLFENKKEISLDNFIGDTFFIPFKVINLFNFFENKKIKKIILKLENEYRG